MSLSRECSVCPFFTGFEVGKNKVLTTCGDPSQRCINLRNKLPEQVATWMRFAEIAEYSRNGILDLSLLYPGEALRIYSSVPGHGWGDSDRVMRIDIEDVINGTLHGTVVSDSYNDSSDLDAQYYARQPGSSILVYGALEKNPDDGEMDYYWSGLNFPGQLHLGRYTKYGSPDSGDFFFGLHIQEVVLINAEDSLCMRLFNTDPDIYRPAPPVS
jgi:hypothetical protein